MHTWFVSVTMYGCLNCATGCTRVGVGNGGTCGVGYGITPLKMAPAPLMLGMPLPQASDILKEVNKYCEFSLIHNKLIAFIYIYFRSF